MPRISDPMAIGAVFPCRLREALDHKGWSQAELARTSEVSVGHISMMLRGQRKPSLATAVRLARELEVSLDWLAGLSEAQ